MLETQNLGMAYLTPQGEMQRQDKVVPAELAHMEALTRLNKANAGALELSQSLQKSGLEAVRGFEFDTKDPAGSLYKLAGRVVGTQPVLAEKLVAAGAISAQRSAQAEAQRALAAQRAAAQARKSTDAIFGAYRGLTEVTPKALDQARHVAAMQGAAAGMTPEEIQDAVQHMEAILNDRGPLGVQDLIRETASAHDLIQADLRKQEEARKKAADEERKREAKVREEQRAKEEEGRNTRAEAHLKAGGGVAGKPGKEPALKLSQSELTKDATAAVAADPVLVRGNAADKLNWTRQVAGKILEKIEESERLHRQNPNIPIMKREDATREALQEVRQTVEQTPGALDRLTGSPGETKPRASITKEGYEKLKKGDKYWYVDPKTGKGRELTKE